MASYGQIESKYVVDATGLNPQIRRRLRPEDFKGKKTKSGGALNYYIDGESKLLDRNTLYQFWDLNWNDTMFAWVYTKSIEEKIYWVVGTGCETGSLKDRTNAFYAYIEEKFGLEGELAFKEVSANQC